MILLLLIHKYPGCGKGDLCEYVFGERNFHVSYIDKPLQLLVDDKLVKRQQNKGAACRLGETRTLYTITAKGRKLLGTSDHF